jgi:hypothetical protein
VPLDFVEHLLAFVPFQLVDFDTLVGDAAPV